MPNFAMLLAKGVPVEHDDQYKRLCTLNMIRPHVIST